MNKSIRISITIFVLTAFALTASAHARGEIQPAVNQRNSQPYAYCGQIQSHTNWLPPQVQRQLKTICSQQ